MCAPGVIKAKQNDTPTKDKILQLAPKIYVNPSLILQPVLGVINPDMLYLCRRSLSGLQRAVFAFFPLFGESR